MGDGPLEGETLATLGTVGYGAVASAIQAAFRTVNNVTGLVATGAQLDSPIWQSLLEEIGGEDESETR